MSAFRRLIATASLLVGQTAASAATWHVDTSAAVGGDGTGWATAFVYLQDAMTHPDLTGGDRVWVAQGTYYPDRDAENPDGTDDRFASFDLRNAVQIYGGFPPGGGTGNFADRDPALYTTELSGDLFDRVEPSWTPCIDPHPDAGNAFQVTPGVTGCTDGSCCNLVCDEVPYCCAVQWDDLCVTVAQELCSRVYHVVFAFGIGQQARLDGFLITGGLAVGGAWDLSNGAGLTAMFSSPTIVSCVFANNVATGRGGGLYAHGGLGSPRLVNCTFANNLAGRGGAVGTQIGNPVFTNCVFRNNAALPGPGGAVSGNGLGGEVFNSTFIGNRAQTPGGAIAGIVNVANVIVWGSLPDQIADTASVTYSCIQDGYEGTGNISLDPAFIDSAGGNYRLGPGSPCIDLGSNQALPNDVADLDGDLQLFEPTPLDLDLHPRTVNDIVDAGAYEACQYTFDLDGDGTVGIGDFLAVLATWGTSPDGPPDFDGDGMVGVTDLLLLLVAWGPC